MDFLNQVGSNSDSNDEEYNVLDPKRTKFNKDDIFLARPPKAKDEQFVFSDMKSLNIIYNIVNESDSIWDSCSTQDWINKLIIPQWTHATCGLACIANVVKICQPTILLPFFYKIGLDNDWINVKDYQIEFENKQTKTKIKCFEIEENIQDLKPGLQNLIATTKKGHYIVLMSIDKNGLFTVVDPYHGLIVTLTNKDIKTLLNNDALISVEITSSKSPGINFNNSTGRLYQKIQDKITKQK